MWIHWLKKVCYAALPCLKKLLNQKSVDDINGCTRWNVLLLPGPHLAEVLDPGPLDWQSVAVSWMTEKGESFGWKSLHTEADLCFSRPVQALSTDTIWRLVAAFWRTDSDSRWRIWEGNLEQVLVHGWFGIEAPGISSMGPCKSWRAVMLELENGTGHRMQSWCLVGSDSKFKRSNRELYDSDPGEQPSLSLSLQALLPAAAAAHAGLFTGWKNWERISGRQVDGAVGTETFTLQGSDTGMEILFQDVQDWKWVNMTMSQELQSVKSKNLCRWWNPAVNQP